MGLLYLAPFELHSQTLLFEVYNVKSLSHKASTEVVIKIISLLSSQG